MSIVAPVVPANLGFHEPFVVSAGVLKRPVFDRSGLWQDHFWSFLEISSLVSCSRLRMKQSECDVNSRV